VGNELRAIIVDDEPLGRRAIRQELERHPEVRVVAECENGKEAIGAIAESDADVVFLDIQMPLGNGFDVVDAIGSAARPIVVFVTAYNEHAVRAFDVHAVDYLLKPIDGARFDEALARVRDRLTDADDAIARRVQAAVRELAARTLSGSGRGTRITIRDAGKVIFLWTGEIDWLAAEGNYVRVHAGRRDILARTTLQRMIETVNDPRFVRVHRSTVVNGDAISHIEHAGKGLYVLVLRDGSRVESSYHYRNEVMQLIEGS
jgi:two-component system, LytTR family, response regulator